MRIRVNIFEMAYRRSRVKDVVDDHVQQMVENWCLVYLAQKYPRYAKHLKHWVDELTAQFVPGLSKLQACGLDARGKAKLVDEVLVHDAELHRFDIVYDMLDYKFDKEGIDDKLHEEATKAWLETGLGEARAVLCREMPLVAYKRSKLSKEPV